MEVTIFSNLFPSGHYLIKSLQLTSAACCTGRCRHTNKFTTIHFDDGNVSGGFYLKMFICLNIMYAKMRVQNKTLSKIN